MNAIARIAVAIGASAATCLQIVGCSSSEAPALRLGTNVWPGYEPLYLAEQLGYFPDDTIDLVEYLSASEVLRAFRNESIEAAALTLDEALVLLDNGIPIKIILVTDFSAGGDVILAHAGIDDMLGLAGKRIGVEGGALGAYMLSRALELHDVALDSIDVVQLEVSEHASAYLNNTVDAVVTFEPVRSTLMAAGAKEIFTSREIPGEIVDVVVVRDAYLTRHPDRVAAVVSAWFRALEYYENHPEDAATRMSARSGITPEQMLDSVQGLEFPTPQDNAELLGGAPPQLVGTVESLQDLMLRQELLSGPVPIETLFAPTVLQVKTR